MPARGAEALGVPDSGCGLCLEDDLGMGAVYSRLDPTPIVEQGSLDNFAALCKSFFLNFPKVELEFVPELRGSWHVFLKKEF
jgi:hypothetical protein